LAIVPLRDIGKLGVLTDIDPYDLPAPAFSFAKNIRIENNRIERGSVFRTAGALSKNPRHLFGYSDKNTNAQLLTVNDDGSVWQWSPTTGHISVTVGGYVGGVSSLPVTSCAVNNVVFINRPDRNIWYRSKDGTGPFLGLPEGPGQWTNGVSAQAISSIKGCVVAMNLTKSGSRYPNNVLWSDFVPLDQPPVWDITLATYPSSSAGENTLADMIGPIVDGEPLKDRLFIFGQDETWYMEYVGGNDMFKFDRQFDKGCVNANCAVVVDSIQYVFGPNDIWAHDGVTEKSMAQDRVRRFIYEGMKNSAKSSFFVAHHPEQTEIHFCYVSDDRFVRFPSDKGTGCNRAAIYNYASQVWYFADLPYVTHATQLAINIPRSFDATSMTFDSLGGSFSAQAGETKLQYLVGSDQNTTYGLSCSLKTFARYSSTSTSFPIDAPANTGALLYREGLDLDELQAELRGYKLCSSLWPQIRIDPNAQPLVFTVGSCDHPNAVPIWGNTQTYDNTWTKLDHNIAGRFLAYKIEQSDYLPFSMSGFDFDLTLLGKR
jgi:hypothetical protein